MIRRTSSPGDPGGARDRLLFKYRTLAALRGRREELQRQGIDRFEGAEAAARRAAFRTLAEEFPGSLRELDVTSAAALRARADELEDVVDLPAWALVTAAYHATLREALAVKRFLAQRLPRGGAPDAALVAAFRSWHDAWPHRHGALPEGDVAAFLAAHLSPPGGRVQALVWDALAARFARSRAELEALVFGAATPAS